MELRTGVRGSDRSLPSARISTIRPSAFSLTRIIAPLGLFDSLCSAKALFMSRAPHCLVLTPGMPWRLSRRGRGARYQPVDLLARRGLGKQEALHLAAAREP